MYYIHFKLKLKYPTSDLSFVPFCSINFNERFCVYTATVCQTTLFVRLEKTSKPSLIIWGKTEMTIELQTNI